MFSSVFIIPQKEIYDYETPFTNYSSSENNSKEDGSLPIQGDSNDFSSSFLDKDPMITVDELKQHYKIVSNKEGENNDIVSGSNGTGDSNDTTNKTKNPQKKTKRIRKLDKDNVRRKIKRRIFNSYLLDKLEKLRRYIKCKHYFKKFPSLFVYDIDRKRNKNYLNLTIKEIITNKEFYKAKNEQENYRLNLKTVQNKEIKENEGFQKILNMTYRELIEEYINYEEFKIGELNHLKMKKFDDKYINKYKELAEELINFFVNESRID